MKCISALSAFFWLLSFRDISMSAIKEILGHLVAASVCYVYAHKIAGQQSEKGAAATTIQDEATTESKGSAVNLIANVSHDMRTVGSFQLRTYPLPYLFCCCFCLVPLNSLSLLWKAAVKLLKPETCASTCRSILHTQWLKESLLNICG